MASLNENRLLASVALVFLASPAAAQSVEGEAFAQRLESVTEEQGTSMRFGDVATEGDTVILSDVFVGEGEGEVALGTMRFESVSGSNAEGWRVERIPMEDVEVSAEEGVTTRTSGLVVEGLTIAPEGEEPALTDLQFERMALDSLTAGEEGEEAFRLSGFEVVNTPGEEGGFAAEFAVDEFVIDTTTGEGSNGAATMAALGYPQLRGNITGNALWNAESGELSLSPLLVNVEDAGELTFAYTITGYTPAFVQSLTQLQQQMAEDPENSGSGMAMIGLISQLYLNSAEIVFQDESLTDRLLDYYAEENNQSRDEIISSLLGMLPLALGYLNNPEFQAEVTEAIEAFLRDPQSLTVAIAPDEPIPATQIVGAAAAAPATLPAILDLTVTSND